jgi:hypothetical protein
MQNSSHLLMIRPVNFGFNAQTAVNNAFQSEQAAPGTQEKARQEFDEFVDLLRKNDIDVTVVDDCPLPHTPDSIFPNNWISFHSDGTLVLYPMFAENRRQERKPAVLDAIHQKFNVSRTLDLSSHEDESFFLEGTGSMVLDRDSMVAYACISPRTDPVLLNDFAELMEYRVVSFDAMDKNGQPIYHTNVMMCIADRYAVICLDAIPAQHEKELVSSFIGESGKKIIPISLEQMNHFAGNMLQVQNLKGEKLLAMSSQAYNALRQEQRELLSSFNRILHAPLDTIETNGGGSARCMMAEVFLPLKSST